MNIACGTGDSAAVLGLVPQDVDRDPQVEPAALRLGLAHHVRLKRREIVRQAGHRRVHHARVPQLR